MVAEGHAAVLEGAGAGLGDVVKQGGQTHRHLGLSLAHHGDRVAEDVLMPVDGILFHPQSQQFGDQVVHLAGVH